MPIKLRDQNGYYSREVKIGGTTFKIRELDDETLDQVTGIEGELREMLEGLGLTPELALQAMKLGDEAVSPELLQALSGLVQAPDDVARTVRTLQRRRRDVIVSRGLVGWDIPQTPFEPEKATLLPEWVKAALAKEILQDSVMPEATQDFLLGSPVQSLRGSRPN